MQAKVVNVVKNIKPSYTTSFGTFFVHGIGFEGYSKMYEYHSKSENCAKIVPGSVQAYTVTSDAKGNLKIKLESGFNKPQQTQPNAPTPAKNSNSSELNKVLDDFQAIINKWRS